MGSDILVQVIPETLEPLYPSRTISLVRHNSENVFMVVLDNPIGPYNPRFSVWGSSLDRNTYVVSLDRDIRGYPSRNVMFSKGGAYYGSGVRRRRRRKAMGGRSTYRMAGSGVRRRRKRGTRKR